MPRVSAAVATMDNRFGDLRPLVRRRTRFDAERAPDPHDRRAESVRDVEHGVDVTTDLRRAREVRAVGHHPQAGVLGARGAPRPRRPGHPVARARRHPTRWPPARRRRPSSRPRRSTAPAASPSTARPAAARPRRASGDAVEVGLHDRVQGREPGGEPLDLLDRQVGQSPQLGAGGTGDVRRQRPRWAAGARASRPAAARARSRRAPPPAARSRARPAARRGRRAGPERC